MTGLSEHTRSFKFALAIAGCAACAGGGAGPDHGPADVEDVAEEDAGPPTDASSDGVDGCAGDGADDSGASQRPGGADGTKVRFDLDGPLEGDAFYRWPFPSDVRLGEGGRQSWTGMPRPARITLVTDIIGQAEDRRGWSTMPIVYFAFDGPVRDDDLGHLHVDDDALWFVDIDDASPARGERIPALTDVLPRDAYVPENLLAVVPRPGFLLRPQTTYAVALTRDFGDEEGERLGVPRALAEIAAGFTPDGERGSAAVAALAPAFDVLGEFGVGADEVAALTVFTTGDPAERLVRLSDDAVERYSPEITDLRVADGGAEHARFCVVEGTIALPQFQDGIPPFTGGGGTFVLDADGRLVEQRLEEVPIVLTLPRGEVPDDGVPIVVYLHGTGGVTTQVVDRGPVLEEGGERTPGLGPAHVLAARGFGTVGTALPLNPQRTPGAGDLAYITGNLLAFRDNISQGAIEQRLTFDALESLAIPADVVAGCGDGLDGAGEISLDMRRGFLMGQSQGGHYANVVAALDPRVEAVVPTGAGGYQSWLILTQPGSDLGRLLPVLLEADREMTFTHPSMAALQSAWEEVEPLVYMRRLHAWPLPGHDPTSVYAPVAPGDSFYTTDIYDAVSLAYSSPRAGAEAWSSMQQALALVGLDERVSYPVVGNVGGGAATAAIVQYRGDGLADPHGIFAQLDSVKFQYGCFFESALRDGVPTLPAPADISADCP